MLPLGRGEQCSVRESSRKGQRVNNLGTATKGTEAVQEAGQGDFGSLQSCG